MLTLECFSQVSDSIGFSTKETAQLAVNYLDRYTCIEEIELCDYQLVASACLLIAAKLAEPRLPRCQVLVEFGAEAFTISKLKRMELNILKTLDWKLNTITPAFIVNLNKPKLEQRFSTCSAGFWQSCARMLELIYTDIDLACLSPRILAPAALICTHQLVFGDCEDRAFADEVFRVFSPSSPRPEKLRFAIIKAIAKVYAAVDDRVSQEQLCRTVADDEYFREIKRREDMYEQQYTEMLADYQSSASQETVSQETVSQETVSLETTSQETIRSLETDNDDSDSFAPPTAHTAHLPSELVCEQSDADTCSSIFSQSTSAESSALPSPTHFSVLYSLESLDVSSSFESVCVSQADSIVKPFVAGPDDDQLFAHHLHEQTEN